MIAYQRRRSHKKSIITLAAIGGAVLVIALWIYLPPLAQMHARDLVKKAAATKDINRQELYLKIAVKLDAHNGAATTGLSRVELRSAIERGAGAAEINAAADDLLTHSTSDDDRLLAGLAYIVAGNSSQTSATKGALNHSQALQRLQAADSGTLPLSLELAATGLQNSAERLLQKQPDSFPRDVALGDIYFARNDLGQAVKFYSLATKQNPADIASRERLAASLAKLGRSSEAAAQNQLITKLKDGRP
jgi:tetratricopeptide (TPR) repeat protein